MNNIILKVRQGIEYQYNTDTKLYYNTLTDKWVKNPIVNDKEVKSKFKMAFHPLIDPAIEDMNVNYQLEQRIRFIIYNMVIRCGLSYVKSENNKDYKAGYCWISNTDLLKILGKDYKELIQELVLRNVIVMDINTSPCGKIYLYKLNDMIDVDLIQEKTVTSERVVKILRKFATKKCDKDIISHHVVKFKHIDIPRKVIDKIYYDKWHNSDKNMSLEQYMIYAKYCWKVIEAWNDGDVNYKFSTFNIKDDFGHRFHSIFSYLPSAIRAYVGDSVVCFDVVNSQPTILADILVRSKTYERDDFIRLVEDGQIYEVTAEKVGCTRDEAKPMIYTPMYCKPTSKAHKEFCKLYPNTGKELTKMKINKFDNEGNEIPLPIRYKQVSKTMQRRESNIWRKIWKDLIKRGYKIIPVHDSVYIVNPTEENLRYVRSYITKELNKSFRVEIKIKETKCKKLNINK